MNMCLSMVGTYKMHIEEIDIKNSVHKYYLENSIKTKKIGIFNEWDGNLFS